MLFFPPLRKLFCWRYWIFCLIENYLSIASPKSLQFKLLWTTGLVEGCAGSQHPFQQSLIMESMFNGRSQVVWVSVLWELGEEDLSVELSQPNFNLHPSYCHRFKCNHIYHQKPFPLLKTRHQTLIHWAILTQWWKCQQYVSEKEPKAWGIVQLTGCCC